MADPRRSRRVIVAIRCLVLCLLCTGSQAFSQAVHTSHLSVELVTEATSIAPNQDFLVGLNFVLDKGWHIYWSNPGDAGLPPRIDWQLPDAITAGELQFPAPQRLSLGPLMDYGYQDQVLLLVPMRVDASIKPGSKAVLRGHLHFLVCSNVCIPGQAELERTIPISAAAGISNPQYELLFLAAKRTLPRGLPSGVSVSVSQTKTAFVVRFQAGHPIATAEFYPFDPNLIANAAPQKIRLLADGVEIAVLKAQGLTQSPAALHGLLKLSDGSAYEFTSSITTAGMPSGGNSPHLWRILGLAFLGGLILNLMPCVFPVLFIKGLSLVQASGHQRKQLRLHGAMYAAGILVSFWIIVAALLLLRAGGHHLGWGFQFQSPYFVAFMALLFFFLGLSLAGQFEIGLSATSIGGELAQRSGYSGSFFTGVLATVVATPCVAPFMGAAIGFALSQTTVVAFAVFTLLALGLATPYVLLTLQPAWLRLLPRPGAWMEYLKQAVSIPIFIAVIWMVWVFEQIAGSNGVAALLIGMLMTAIAGWILGHWPARWPATITAMLLLMIAIALPSIAAKRFDAAPIKTPNQTSSDAPAWQPFDPKTLAADLAEGKAVFVDFSAAWCLSCQVNERLVLNRPDVEAEFRRNKVVMMRADWTNHDDIIANALAHLDRSAVPTYALYSGAAENPPTLLPEVLTRKIIFDALARVETRP